MLHEGVVGGGGGEGEEGRGLIMKKELRLKRMRKYGANLLMVMSLERKGLAVSLTVATVSREEFLLSRSL